MKTTRTILPLATVVFCALLFNGCAKNAEQNATPQTNASAAALSNPTDFPLYQSSTVVSVRPFTETISNAQHNATSALPSGNGTYSGQTVIAQSTASLTQLKSWLATTESSPPSGYSNLAQAQHPSAVNVASKYGIAYGVFKKPATNGNVVVAVIDPAITHDKVGFLLSMIDKYQMLPAPLKSKVDEQVRARTGYSLQTLTDPSSPVGITLTAIRTVQSSGQRAIVLVDATKQKP